MSEVNLKKQEDKLPYNAYELYNGKQMSEHKKKSSLGKAAARFLLVPGGLVVLITLFLRGKNVALLNPKGLIAHDEHGLLVFTLLVLLAATIPTLFILFFIAWKYSESNTKTVHLTAVRPRKFLVLSMWLIPTTVAVVLANVMIPATHKLAPKSVIASSVKPLTIQVISMRWKWLFIYPEQNIATINFVQIPVGTPVTFELTADETPMSSFWIPNLGGQLYSMTSHVNRLNLMASETGDYPGSSAELNGNGFAEMKFVARASTEQDFETWLQSIRTSSKTLDADEYQKLLTPSEGNPAAFYSSSETDLYDKVLVKYSGSHQHGAEL